MGSASHVTALIRTRRCGHAIDPEGSVMRWFRRKDPPLTPCPQCSKLLAADAETCDLCGADLEEFLARRRAVTEAQTRS